MELPKGAKITHSGLLQHNADGTTDIQKITQAGLVARWVISLLLKGLSCVASQQLFTWDKCWSWSSYNFECLLVRSPEGTAAKGMNIRGNEDLWVEIQANTFRNWVNEHLRDVDLQVSWSC